MSPLLLPNADANIKKDKPFKFMYTYSVFFVVSLCVYVRACVRARERERVTTSNSLRKRSFLLLCRGMILSAGHLDGTTF